MSKVAIAIGDLFEDVEYTEPAEALKKAGHELVHVGLKSGDIVKGKKKGIEVTVDKTAKEVSVADFDALVIPGGESPDKLRVDEDMVRFAKEFVESGKPVCTICHGPQLLITAQVLNGRTMTCWKSMIQDLKNAGATFIDQELVVDGNLISSRFPGDLPAFIGACLDSLK